MLESEFLRAIQSEIRKHDLNTFKNESVTVPGCPACRKTLYTVSQYNDHLR
jgi:hypothetical protein